MTTTASRSATKTKSTKPAAPDEAQQVEELLEAIQPSAAHRTQLIAGHPDGLYSEFSKTYVQKPLNYFGKVELIAAFGQATRQAYESGVSAADLSSSIAGLNGGSTSSASLDQWLGVLAALAEAAPDLLKRLYFISLGVPRHERALVAEIFDEPFDEKSGRGGLSDDDGLEILSTFIAQNGKVLTDFFSERLPKIVQAAVKHTNQSPAQE